jgi:hypothetical protein
LFIAEARGYPEEIRALLDATRFLAREAHAGFVDKRGALQRVATPLHSQIMSSPLVEPLVHQPE